MNDKCAPAPARPSTSAFSRSTRRRVVATIPSIDTKLHHVAAKCGVFAETDIVNLIKSGIPANEVLCSLADAIVHQNL